MSLVWAQVLRTVRLLMHVIVPLSSLCTILSTASIAVVGVAATIVLNLLSILWTVEYFSEYWLIFNMALIVITWSYDRRRSLVLLHNSVSTEACLESVYLDLERS